MTVGFLGIDVGLSGARAVVISARGKMLAQAKLEGATGTMSPLRLASLVDRTVRLALKGRPRISISSIAVAAFGPAPILLDERGHVLAQLRLFGEPADEAVDDDLEARLRQFRRLSPLLYRKACRICDVTGYLVAQLTGQLTMDHATAADYERLSLPRRIVLPRIAAGDDRAGSLTAAAARRLGLSAGLPVAVGAYDSTADLVAAGFGKGREAVIILGSTMVLGALTAAPLRDRGLRSMPHLDPGWFSGGWTSCTGVSLALAYMLKRQTGFRLFLEDGHVDMDSNLVENAIRSPAMNRRNALFAGHDEGGRSWARMASLIGSPRMNGVDPYAYLLYLFTRLAQGHLNKDIDALMPWAFAAADSNPSQ